MDKAKKWKWLLLFGAWFFTGPALVNAQALPSSTARIAVWNLQGFTPITEERSKNQVEAPKFLGAEIVALVEVNPTITMDRMRDQLNNAGLCYRSVILDQEAMLDIGVLYKCGVIALNPLLLEGSDLGMANMRKAFVVNMEVGKFDFLLIVVHFKAGRNAMDQAFRDQRAKVVANFISQELAERPREDIMVVGDFNMIPEQDVSNFHTLGGQDQMVFISSWDLREPYSHILPSGPANLLDEFAITRTFTSEYIPGSLRVYPLHRALDMGLEKFRDTISDHLPFVAKFRTDRDAD